MKSIPKEKKEVKEEKIIKEDEYQKAIEMPDGSVRIIKKAGPEKPKKDWREWISQKWWRNDLKGLNPIERCILISWKIATSSKFIPSERFIARELGISRNTVAKYIRKLGKMKLL